VQSFSNKIKNYTSSYSKNKIIIHKELLDEIPSIDIGLLLSNELINQNSDRLIPMHVYFELEKILSNNIKQHNEYGKCLYLKNFGILLEPQLKLNLIKILENFSNNNTLFIHWEGHIENNILYFLTKENGLQINIKELSHIIV
jgi:mRNA-degrading endonuclease HigB of HigAB toxin-antitoxin module